MGLIRNVVAFDCSNTNIRTILGQYDGERIRAEVVYQQPNEPVRILDYEYWDILKIFQAMLQGLKLAVSQTERIDSVGVCTWGIDFAFFTREGVMLGNPLAYRNSLGAEAMKDFSEEELSRFFEETGILSDQINSLFMLRGIEKHIPTLKSGAHRLLMVPDIFNYLLTGVMQNEPSELSTSQLFDVRTHRINPYNCEAAGISPELFPPLGEHGKRIGNLVPYIKQYLGIDYDIPVICVPSHDTASAILALPAEESDFAYISSGTWALIGTELDRPLLQKQVEQYRLTNELGAFDKITLLKNHAGMFIVQKLREEYDWDLNWDDFYALSDQVDDRAPVFDVNGQEFFHPESMIRAIQEEFKRTGQLTGDADVPTILKSFLFSMAVGYRETVQQIEQVSGKQFQSIYLVGGGSKNVRLNQLAADFTGKRIVTGSSESTSYGNIAAQLKYFEPEKTVAQLRQIVKNSTSTAVYESRGSKPEVLERYQRIYRN